MISSPSGVVDNTVSTAKIQNGAVTAVKCGAGTVRRIATTTVAGAAVTSISFTGLSLDGKDYLIIGEIKRTGGAESLINIRFNGDTNDAHYKNIRLYGSGVVASSTVPATPVAAYFNTASSSAFRYQIAKIAGDVPHAFGHTGVGSIATANDNMFITWTDTVNITQIDFTADAANAIAIGSFISIYAVD